MKFKPHIILVCIILCLFFAFCKSDHKKSKLIDLNVYEINNPKIIKLPPELSEISGIDYYAKDSSLFSIADDDKCFFKILLADESVRRWNIHKGKDLEDIVLLDSSIFILQNNGDILETDRINNKKVQHFRFPEEYGKVEFESLYKSPDRQWLILICKDCKADDGSKISTFMFNIRNKTYSDSSFTINGKKIVHAAVNSEQKHFKPSAAAINPKDSLLYILSSINKCIAVTTLSGDVEKVYILNPKMYKQPEGITFAPNGDMFITNEAAGFGPAELLVLKYSDK